MRSHSFVRTAMSLACLITVARATGAQSSSARSSLPKPPGNLVDIGGGQRLHLNCTGKGSPTVVFENGAGDFSMIWSLVQPRVAEFTRACSYDRAGYAWSDPGLRPRTYDQIALELNTALQRARERGPWVVVGQSYGGLVARGFARNYLPQMSGIVLVDAVHEDQRVNMGGKPQRIRDFASGRVRPTARIGLDTALAKLRAGGAARHVDSTALDEPLNRLPGMAQDLWRRASVDSVYRLSWAGEMDWSPEELARMHAERERDRATLGDMNLVVISRAAETPADTLTKERAALQRDLATLSHHSMHIVAPNAGHNVHVEDPELVIAHIKLLVELQRTGRTLGQPPAKP